MMENKNGFSKHTLEILAAAARDGDRLVYEPADGDKPKNIWAGLGNSSGLHSFAEELTSRKWAKSGSRLQKKLAALTSGTVTVFTFHNVTRDRGRWIAGRSHWIGSVSK